jgi:hypothetical protein
LKVEVDGSEGSAAICHIRLPSADLFLYLKLPGKHETPGGALPPLPPPLRESAHWEKLPVTGRQQPKLLGVKLRNWFLEEEMGDTNED